MTDVRQLPDDHAALRPAIDALKRTADAVAIGSLAQLRGAVDADRLYLHAELLPHLEAEEEVLYPALREALGSRTATLGMEHDHAQIRALAASVADIDAELADVDQLSPEMATRIRRVFYGLYALLLNHFDKEQLIYHPYLERGCSPQRLAALFAAVDTEATRRALAATS